MKPAPHSMSRRLARRQQTQQRRAKPELPVRIDMPGAVVKLLPGHFRNAAYVRTHVSYVVEMGPLKGEEHIVRNLSTIEDNLRKIGVDEATIAAEMRIIEGRVRAELWKQILLPGGDQ